MVFKAVTRRWGVSGLQNFSLCGEVIEKSRRAAITKEWIARARALAYNVLASATAAIKISSRPARTPWSVG